MPLLTPARLAVALGAILVIAVMGRVFWWISRACPGVSPRSWRWVLLLLIVAAVVAAVVVTSK